MRMNALLPAETVLQPDRRWTSYNLTIAVVAALLASAALTWGLKGRDHFAAIAMASDPGYYLDFAGRKTPEIQDQELFYHNIGGSITAARKADVVLLGPSFVTYAFEPSALRQFEAANKRRVYNMSFIGIRGGEFVRRIITRWQVKAPLWVINVDDQFIHFFSRSLDLTLGPATTTIPAAEHGRTRGYLSVAARNFRLRMDGYNGSQGAIYRNIETGDATVDSNPKYVADNNTQIQFERNRDCHVSPETVAIARDYLRDIQGHVVLIMVPHSQYCPAQGRELAKALGVEIILAPDQGYTTIDGGGHLDRKAALKFTDYVMSELTKTQAYAAAFGDRRRD
jgi:cellobiose-specific phosphotransferase system component IIB